MDWLRRILHCARVSLPELKELASVTAGLHDVYAPAALILADAALVFIAQGIERDG